MPLPSRNVQIERLRQEVDTRPARWLCRCQKCGTERGVIGANLTRGLSTSCGCFRRDGRDVRTEDLVAFVRAGHSISEAARRFAIGRRTVRTRLRNAGYPRPFLTPLPLRGRKGAIYAIETALLPEDYRDYFTTTGDAVCKCDYWLTRTEPGSPEHRTVSRFRDELLRARGEAVFLEVTWEEGVLEARPVNPRGEEHRRRRSA